MSVKLKRRITVLAAALTLAGAAAVTMTAGPAHAAIPTTRFTLDAIGASAANPFGQSLNASNWAGEGSSSTCVTGAGVVNDWIGVWKNSGAGCASDWQVVANTTPVNTFEIEYNPGGLTTASLCVSTIANLPGVRSRLRPCSFTGTNPWQTFIRVPEAGSDITGGFEIQAALTTTQCSGGPCVLNDLRYAQNNGMSIAVWPNTHTPNEIFLSH